MLIVDSGVGLVMVMTNDSDNANWGCLMCSRKRRADHDDIGVAGCGDDHRNDDDDGHI